MTARPILVHRHPLGGSGLLQCNRPRQRFCSADARVRQNLALVIGLQGRFNEAADIARADLPPDQADANVAYLKQMLNDRAALPANKRVLASDRS